MALTKNRRRRRIWQRLQIRFGMLTICINFCIISSMVPCIEMYQLKSMNNANSTSVCDSTPSMCIMSYIVRDPPFPNGYTTSDTKNFGPKENENRWRDLINYHWLVLMTAVFVGFIVLAVPIFGIFFYIGRYCYGHLGGRYYDLKIARYDKMLYILYFLLLVLLAIGILICIIYMTTANGHFFSGQREKKQYRMLENADVERERRFSIFTHVLLNHTFVTNYNELTSNMYVVITNSTFIDKYMKNSKSFVEGYNKVTDKQLLTVVLTSTELITLATQLIDMTRSIQRDMLENYNPKSELSQDAIFTIENSESILTYPIPQLIDYSVLSVEYDKIFEKKVKEQLDKTELFYNPLKSSWKAQTTPITKAFVAEGPGLAKPIQRLDELEAKVRNQPPLQFDLTDEFQRGGAIETFRFYTSLLICTVILLILIGLVCALLFALCGKRPGGPRKRFCNRAVGATLLMLVLALVILFTSLLAIYAFMHFLHGIIAYHVLCQSVDPAAWDVSSHSLHLLETCRNKKSLFKLLGVPNITSTEEIKNINSQLYNLDKVDFKVTPLVYETAYVSDIKFMSRYDFRTMVMDMKTRISKESEALENLGSSLENDQLTRTLNARDNTQNNIINNINSRIDILDKMITYKNENNGLSFTESVDHVFTEIDDLLQLNTDIPIFRNYLHTELKKYTTMVDDFMHDQEFVCALMAAVPTKKYTDRFTVCCDIVYPFVLFAIASLYCIIFFLLPIIPLAVLLGKLLRKPAEQDYRTLNQRQESTDSSTPSTTSAESTARNLAAQKERSIQERTEIRTPSTTSTESTARNLAAQKVGYAHNSLLSPMVVFPNMTSHALHRPTTSAEIETNAPIQPVRSRAPRSTRRITRRSAPVPSEDRITIHFTESQGGITSYTRVDINPDKVKALRTNLAGSGSPNDTVYAEQYFQPAQVTRATTRSGVSRGRPAIYAQESFAPTHSTRMTIRPERTTTGRSNIGGPGEAYAPLHGTQTTRRSRRTSIEPGASVEPRARMESFSVPERRTSTRDKSISQQARSNSQTRRSNSGPN